MKELKIEIMKEIKDVFIKALIDNKGIIIDEVLNWKLCNRCKITTNNIYEHSFICMKFTEMETITCSICDENKI